MKITLSIDEEGLQIARQYAAGNGVRLGKAESLLIKRAVAEPLTMRRNSAGFMVYDLPPGKSITSAMVKRFLNG